MNARVFARRTGSSERGPARDGEQGVVMMLAMIVIIGLLGLSATLVSSIRGSISASSHHHFANQAIYAAESGVVAAVEHLRVNMDLANGWTAYLDAAQWDNIPGNAIEPGQSGYPFGATSNSWYSVRVLNNASDPEFSAGTDGDFRVIVEATGHASDGSSTRVSVEIGPAGTSVVATGCQTRGVEGMNADGAGSANCEELSNIDGTSDVVTAVFGGS